MAIFRGVGGSGDSSDNSFLQEVTAQANAASASASAASASASAASASASSILNLTAATGAAGTEASYDASTGVLTIPRGDAGVDAVVDTASVSAAGALMDSEVTNLAQVKAFDSSDYATSAQGTTADNALPKAGGQMTGNITFSGTQTVDGRDISVDGSRLDTIPFNRVTHRKLRGSASLILTTTPQSVSQYENTIHPSTPVKCSRYIDLSMVTQWRYVSSTTNDLQLQFQVIVPSGSPTVTNLGTITKGPFTDYTIGTYEQWFYVSGDYTHLFTDFGRLNKTGTSGATEFTVRSFQYDPSTNRTYVLTEDNPGAFVSSGDTVYWHPYAWESAGTALTEYVEIDERYVSYGSQTINIKFKTAYDDSALTYKIKAKEISSQDSGVIYKTTARLIDVEEV